MTSSGPARTTARRIRAILVAGLLVVLAALAAACGDRVLDPSSTTVASTSSAAAPAIDAPAIGAPRRGPRGPLGEADGAVPDGTTAFDDVPGVANLDPALLDALRHAAKDAAEDGIELHVTSGWRSPAYQDQLFADAVAEHGSEEEAARWVATARTSAHVSGDAVDVGPSEAAEWLSEHGAPHGLCRIYGNEPWHFELRPDATDHGCPAMYADPTHDPRMQR